jgi:pyruvate oxidase
MVDCGLWRDREEAARVQAGGRHRVDPVDVPGEGRVRSVTAGGQTVALARCGGLGAGEQVPALSRHLPEDVVVTVDVGNHAYSLGRYLESKGQPVLMSGVSRVDRLRVAACRRLPVWHTSLHNPDWAAYAGLCGATGIKVDSREQPDTSMARLFITDGPVLLHVEQDPELL